MVFNREHRIPEVLMLLRRGIAQYATGMGLRDLLLDLKSLPAAARNRFLARFTS